MFQDKDCFERFALLIVGIGTLGAAAVGLKFAAEGGGVLAGATSLWARLRGQAQSDAPKVVARLSAALRDEWNAWGKTSSHADDNLRASARASFEEVIDRLNLDPAALVGQRLDAQALADLALSRAAVVFPEAYANTDPKNAEAQLTRKFLHDVTLRAYGLLLDDADFVSNIGPALWRAVLGQLDRVEADTKLLVKQMEKAIRELALKEGMVIGVARRIAEGVEDFDTALRELERAIGIAARMERESKLPSNSGEQITHILAELSRLNGENRLDDGARVVMDAFDRLEAERARLIEIGLEQDILRRNVEGTAKWVVRQVLAENAVGRFEALKAVWLRWYERGRDKGLNFDLEVSVNLLRAMREYTINTDEGGYVCNNIGNVLQILGERLGSLKLLDEARKAYSSALIEWTQHRRPQHWAMVQSNLAAVLTTLGKYTKNDDLLNQAVNAYRLSLSERKAKKHPLEWASTQNNLGTVWLALGESQNEERCFVMAIKCLTSALTIRGENSDPLRWAMSQHNLGSALERLASLRQDAKLLIKAISAYDKALGKWDKEKTPLSWVTSFGNSAVALLILASLQSNPNLAQEAKKRLRLAESTARECGAITSADYYASKIPLAQALIDRLSTASP